MAIIFSDDFNRADSGTVGNGWTQGTAGSGASQGISTNRYFCTGNNNGGAGIQRQDISEASGIYFKTVVSSASFTTNGSFIRFFGLLSAAWNYGAAVTTAGYGIVVNDFSATSSNVSIVDGVSTLATGSFTFNNTDQFAIEGTITASPQNHMEVRIWNATSGSRPSTPTFSWTNGGSNYTPTSVGNRTIFQLDQNTATTKTIYMYLFEVGTPSSSFDETYTENMTLNESILKATTRPILEAIGLNDSVLKSISRTIAEAMTTADTFLGEKLIPLLLTEAMALNDGITRQITAVRTEAMALADDVYKSISRTLAEAATLADSITIGIIFDRVLTEALALTSNVTKSTGRVITEAATLTATATKGAVKLLIENMGLNDVFARVWTRILTLTENIGLNDTIQKLLNGSAVIWSRVARNMATWRRIDRDNP